MHSPNVQWRKSSYSGSGDNCVEVAETPEAVVFVRDTQNRHLGYLKFSAQDWTAFLHTLKAGRV